MTNRTAILFIIWLTVVFASLFFLVYLTAALLHTAKTLHAYEPPNQTEDFLQHIEQERLEELRQRVEDLERILSSAILFTVTAYTHAAPGGCINGTGDGITASGVPVREGVVAVDRNLIPLGSKVWVQGFGVLLAADTGGWIRGNRLDIFKECQEAAIQFGRQKRKAAVL